MKKEEPSDPNDQISKLDVAKVLGMDKDYEAGKLAGGQKEFYEELLREEEERNHGKQFSFEDQFSFPADYYKAKLVLKVLDDKIKMTGLAHQPVDIEKLVSFCDKHKIKIRRFDVIKYDESEDPEEPPESHYIDCLYKPSNEEGNQWALNNKKILTYQKENFNVYPVLRINHLVVSQALSLNSAQTDLIDAFDVSFEGDPLLDILFGELILPEGYCIDCGHSEFSFNGSFHSCKTCGSRSILHSNPRFPVTREMLRSLNVLLTSITHENTV